MTVFVDTNVLVYAADVADPVKHDRAKVWMEALWQARGGRLSTQVLNEYYVTVTSKLRPGLPPEGARADVRDLMAWEPVAIGTGLRDAGFDIEERLGCSFWDCLIGAAAVAGGADVLLTEGLQDGQDLGGLQVVNPFAQLPENVL